MTGFNPEIDLKVGSPLLKTELDITDIRSSEDIVALYRSRLNGLDSLKYAETMLMTSAYQNYAFDLVVKMLKEIDCNELMDIGCGCGCLLERLRLNGYQGHYIGIVLVPEFIAKAKARFVEDKNAEFIVGDVLNKNTWSPFTGNENSAHITGDVNMLDITNSDVRNELFYQQE